MRANIAEDLGLPIERVNVKAKTNEKLGYLGRGEGIEAQAAALVVRSDAA
jgi:2-C-methyl-D-erythritol 2,4-cyclodiphosphate synthase